MLKIVQLFLKRLSNVIEDNKDAFASTYNLVLQSLAASYKNRGYNSALEAKLFNDNIPLEVFYKL